MSRSFANGDISTIDASPEACASLTTLQNGRPQHDSEAAFDQRWQTALSLFTLSDEDAQRARTLYHARWDSRGKNGSQPPTGPHTPHQDSARIGEKAGRLAAALGPMREGGDLSLVGPPGGTPTAPLTGPAVSGDTPENIAARLNAQRFSATQLKTPVVPPADVFNALGGPNIAPTPGLVDRASHLADRFSGKEARVIAQTLAAVRQMAGTLTPDELQRISSLDNTGADSAARFAKWLSDLPPSQLPPITYGVLKQGQLGMTDPRTGAITINHSILNEPPDVQAAVLAHELYHHWDLKVSANFHEETSNYGGYVAPENVPALEFVPYALTRAFADHVAADQNTPLLSDLKRIPGDPEALRSYVEKVVAQDNPK